MRPIKTAECNAVYKGDGADVMDIRVHMLHGVIPHWLEVVDSPEVDE